MAQTFLFQNENLVIKNRDLTINGLHNKNPTKLAIRFSQTGDQNQDQT